LAVVALVLHQPVTELMEQPPFSARLRQQVAVVVEVLLFQAPVVTEGLEVVTVAEIQEPLV
jgi:hypothetical protein